jgi:tellurite resistance protein TehA-like permease
VIGWLTATVMWGFGLVWLFFAAASISRSKFPFNMGWWGFTFPLGVFTTSTTQMAKELPSTFFKVLGTVSFPHFPVVGIPTDVTQIFSVAVTLLWILVMTRTAMKAATGDMFFAPCLKDLEGKKAEAERNCPEQVPV